MTISISITKNTQVMSLGVRVCQLPMNAGIIIMKVGEDLGWVGLSAFGAGGGLSRGTQMRVALPQCVISTHSLPSSGGWSVSMLILQLGI